MTNIQRIKAIDSHTGGEPTRVIVEGFPNPSRGSMADRLEIMSTRYDAWRSAVLNEPRGHSAIVGALLCPPQDPAATAGVIFFNNIGYLGMCGHGTIGLLRTLEFMGKISPGVHRIETPVGNVEAELHSDGDVSISNVVSYRYAKGVVLNVDSYGQVAGDIAYGGNWFFLIGDHGLEIEYENLHQLMEYSVAVRKALSKGNITGHNGAEIDHIELFSPSTTADSKNFVLCPGLDYDRSPCGTGTSAKLACLHADGDLKEGELWRQESIVGSIFEGHIRLEGENIIPIIRGKAHITAEIELVFEEGDPYRFGISK
jgi:4-hydroxyproline epimerase